MYSCRWRSPFVLCCTHYSAATTIKHLFKIEAMQATALVFYQQESTVFRKNSQGNLTSKSKFNVANN